MDDSSPALTAAAALGDGEQPLGRVPRLALWALVDRATLSSLAVVDIDEGGQGVAVALKGSLAG